MKTLKISGLLLVLLTLQACSTPQESEPSPTPMPKASLDSPSSISPPTFIMRGEVVIGHEAQTITPCGSNKQFWLTLPQTYAQQVMNLTSRPYQPLYGEVIGHLERPTQMGFDADYTARFVVDHVNFLTAENPNRCDQSLRSTRAFGNEPFWSLSFSKGHINFEPMGEETKTVALDKTLIQQASRKYYFSDGQLSLNKTTCNDTMSDSIYGWKAKLNINKQDYTGCATLANQDPTLAWVGNYFASHTQSVNFSVNLELKSDHTAITTYDYANGDSPTIETGFWQQLNANQIQVVMTRHQRQYLVSERIFTGHNGKITAQKEKVGDTIYPIANGGLVLFQKQGN